MEPRSLFLPQSLASFVSALYELSSVQEIHSQNESHEGKRLQGRLKVQGQAHAYPY